MVVDIEVFEEYNEEGYQAKYLAHGIDDVMWTNSIFDATRFLAQQLTTEEYQ